MSSFSTRKENETTTYSGRSRRNQKKLLNGLCSVNCVVAESGNLSRDYLPDFRQAPGTGASGHIRRCLFFASVDPV